MSMNKAAVLLILILFVAAVFSVLEHRREDPPPTTTSSSPRDTFELMKSFLEKEEYDRIWTLYSIEFREQYSRQIAEMKASVKKEIDKGSEWINEWIFAQVRATPEDFMKMTPRQIDARRNEVDAARIVKQRIENVTIEGESARAIVEREAGAPLSEMSFILRDGKWLVHTSSFMPLK